MLASYGALWVSKVLIRRAAPPLGLLSMPGRLVVERPMREIRIEDFRHGN